ncbi:NAD(P)/FAD-dependent oxidoreductase [Segnochrobactraceae bacterium EtOH-i3]
MDQVDAVVVGAGAAGLMCAGVAGQLGRRVLVVDHADGPGAKILISGGGRCNFTNRETAPDRFLSANRHFAKSALGRYTARDFLALVERHRIPWHEKTLGQLFCDRSARDILGLLMDECAAGRVAFRFGVTVTEVSGAGPFRITFSDGRSVTAGRLVIATGGLSIPKMGATDFAHRIARQYGLAVTPVKPGLVPFTLSDAVKEFARALAGVATEAVVAIGKRRFREALLFTHRGLSGPAILQISSFWEPGVALSIDLAPDRDALAFLKDGRARRPKAEVRTLLAEILPARLAAALTEGAGITGPAGAVSDRAFTALADSVNRWTITPAGTEGFAKAEVTVGGVDTAGLSSRTLEARSVPGLHFIGEGVDVTGWLGGYNFQWAWSSGWCAGQAIAE